MKSIRLPLIVACIALALLIMFTLPSFSSRAESSLTHDAGSRTNTTPVASATGNQALRLLSRSAGPFVEPVNPYNDPPVAVDDTFIVHGITSLNALLANDHDPDGDPMSAVALTDPVNGQIAFGNYHPNSGYTGADSFTYKACDNHGNCSNTANVTVDVRNQVPTANADTYTFHHTGLVGPLLSNDTDPDNDTLRVCDLISSPQHAAQFQVTTTPDIYTYTAQGGFVGQDVFVYKICDDLGGTATASVTVNIANAPPVPNNKRIPVRGNTNINLLLGDTDPEGDDITLNNCCLTNPAHGGLFNTALANTYEYRPDAGFTGTDGFIYRECDSLGACANGTVTLEVVGDGEDDGDNECDSVGNSPDDSVGEPVHVTNGNMYLQQRDYSLVTVGPAIEVRRTYNSNSQRIGLFGKGWSTLYDESVVNHGDDLKRFNESDGRATYFGREFGSAGALQPVEGDFHGELTPNGGGFTLVTKEGMVHQFNSAGRLVSLTDRNGNQTSLTYNGSGHLTAITDAYDNSVSVTTNSNGQVLTIGDTLGTVATYDYGGGTSLLSVTYADNSGFQFTYDGNGRLTTVMDALQNVVESHTYDSLGRALTSERASVMGMAVEHYSLNYVSATETDVTDGLGHVTKYTFDRSQGRGLVTKVEGLCSCGGGGGSQIQTWNYDSQLNVTSKTDALGHVTTFTYDSQGNQLTETDTTGTVTYTYNQFGDVLTRTDQLNGVTTNTYDTHGNLLTTKDALDHTTTFVYNGHGEQEKTIDARGNLTRQAWDEHGHLTQRKDALNQTTDFEEDARARLTSVTNALLETTSYDFDAAGRVNKITYPDDNFITFTYDLAGRRTKFTDARGNETNYVYDAAYRLVSETDALNQTTSYGYNSISKLTSVTDALGRVINFDYDEFNRPVKITYPPAVTGATRLFRTVTYDAAGRISQRTDTTGRVTTYAYDAENRPTSITNADNKTTTFEYDTLSRLTGLVDTLNQHYQFAFDATGQETGITRDGVSVSFQYDPVGNRTQRIDYNGATTTYAYDALNRLQTVNYPNSTTANHAYDRLSRLVEATNENGTVVFSYDNRGWLQSTTDVLGQTVSYGFDANGNRTALMLNDAVYATYQYDAANRLTHLEDADGLPVNYTYDQTDKLKERTLPNGLITKYTYDDLNRLTRITEALESIEGYESIVPVQDDQQHYNTASQIVEKLTRGGTHTYTYDSVDRLTSASHPSGPSEGYSYDGVGNRSTATGIDPVSYTYSSFNRLTNTNLTNYSYDSNGNLISKTDNSTSNTQYAWDFENRLTQVSMISGAQAGAIVSYKYDALGRRIQRSTNNAEELNFVYDGADVIREFDGAGKNAISYLNGPGVDNKIRQTSGENANLYYTLDHEGSTVALTDDSNSPVETIAYDSFGNSTGSSYTRYTYTGHELDADTGLYYYRNRWYDARIGRFISEDPIGLAGGANQYSYVENNPIGAIDPFGLQALAPLSHLNFERRQIDRPTLEGLMTPRGSSTLPDDVKNNLNLGCIGLTKAYQGNPSDGPSPEFFGDTRCYLDKSLAISRKCPRCRRGSRSVVFAKQGDWNPRYNGSNGQTTIIPSPGTGQVPADSIWDNAIRGRETILNHFNYIIYFPSKHSYGWMDYGISYGEQHGFIGSEGYINNLMAHPSDTYPNTIWCKTCKKRE